MIKINDKTSLPLGWIMFSVPTFIGGVMWLSSVAYTTDANAKSIARMEQKLETRDEVLQKIREDVAAIKERIIK